MIVCLILSGIQRLVVPKMLNTPCQFVGLNHELIFKFSYHPKVQLFSLAIRLVFFDFVHHFNSSIFIFTLEHIIPELQFLTIDLFFNYIHSLKYLQLIRLQQPDFKVDLKSAKLKPELRYTFKLVHLFINLTLLFIATCCVEFTLFIVYIIIQVRFDIYDYHLCVLH